MDNYNFTALEHTLWGTFDSDDEESGTARASRSVEYVAAAGDTLFQIASRVRHSLTYVHPFAGRQTARSGGLIIRVSLHGVCRWRPPGARSRWKSSELAWIGTHAFRREQSCTWSSLEYSCEQRVGARRGTHPEMRVSESEGSR